MALFYLTEPIKFDDVLCPATPDLAKPTLGFLCPEMEWGGAAANLIAIPAV